MSKFEIAAALQEIGTLMRFSAKEPFKARAYARAAQSIADYPGDIDQLIADGRLTELKGIGSSLSAVIGDLHNTGRSSILERLRAELPPGILALSQIPKLTLKRIRQLHESLGITNIEDLKAALEAGKVREVPGFGEKTEKALLESLLAFQNSDREVLLIHALRIADKVIAHVRTSEHVIDIDVVGEARRWKEAVSRISITASSRHPQELVKDFLELPAIVRIEEQSPNGARVRQIDGATIEFSVIQPKKYSNLLLIATGSSPHLNHLNKIAQQKKIDLAALNVTTEREIYERLKMQWIPPELREDEGEIEAAVKNEIPEDLITLSDIKGATHCHTVYSDGRNTIEEMALAAEATGMKYITITDHSPSAFYAQGVKLDRLKKQWEEIDRVQENVSIKLLKGTESDILRDGALDYPDRILEKFDVIIASIHSRFSLDEDAMTERVINAMKNRFFKIWGHPLGRLVGRRPPIPCRVDEVLDVIAESGAAIEINGDPYRLDLEPRWIREARKRQIKFVISTDSHSITDLKNLKFGVGIARRGWVRRQEVLNALPANAFKNAVNPGPR